MRWHVAVETGDASPSHRLGLVWNLPQEDTILIDLVQKYGEKRWNMVANGLPGRTGKGCSHRCVLLLSCHLEQRCSALQPSQPTNVIMGEQHSKKLVRTLCKRVLLC
jgi:hypothetical protein